MREVSGTPDGTGRRFALVASRFNHVVTDELVAGAVDALTRHGVASGDIEIIRVPGAWELPATCQRVVERGGVDGIVALGCVIRGETPHFEYVAGEASRGLGAVARSASIPVVFGVLTTETLEQAMTRAGTERNNKGWEAALVALEMATLYREL
ncbi:MAG: 6,7-dimethyl-8-ribityllumazine synthase [Gemmatimonadetes bacterium]|nr:6,7-dimethyl-8-ribityllumazine synthase [Gemmatimonadota bacterium]